MRRAGEATASACTPAESPQQVGPEGSTPRTPSAARAPSAAAPFRREAEQPIKLAVKAATVRRSSPRLQVNDQIQRRQAALRDGLPVVLPHAAPQPVACDGAADPATNGQAQSRPTDGVATRVQHGELALHATATPVHPPEIAAGAQPIGHLLDAGSAARALRPLQDLHRQPLAALAPAARENRPTVPGPHPDAEAVLLLSTPVVRLVGPLQVTSFLKRAVRMAGPGTGRWRRRCGSARAAAWRRGWNSNPRTTWTVQGARETDPWAGAAPRVQRWRRGWDSNPRITCAINGFRDRPIRPLWHLSSLLAARNRSRSVVTERAVAERVGFEPTVELPLHMLSRHAPSTARSPLLIRPDSGSSGRLA